VLSLSYRSILITPKFVAVIDIMTEAPMVSMTQNAVQRLAELIAVKDKSSLMLRVYIQGGGCSGFQYGFQFEEQREEDDLEFERDGVKLLVDSMSLQYLMGSEIDFVDDLMGTRFVVSNPNASTTCGCGSSFAV
jgi:iron-sulfur cluster insertion protein